MVKRILVAALLVLVLGGTALFFWARAALTGPTVRVAVAKQLTEALGQPVAIGELSVQIFPRISLDVGDVHIGAPARITVKKLHIGTALGALLSRKIEHADLKLDGARIELPLPAFAPASANASAGKPAHQAPAAPEHPSTSAPVEIVSVDEIVLNDVELVAGTQTLTGDIELEPHGVNALTIRKLALGAGSTNISITGEVTDVAKSEANLTMQAGAIDALQLLGFVDAFSATPELAALSASGGGPMQVTVAMTADRLTFGALTMDKLSATVLAASDRVTLNQANFNIFNGTANGTVILALDATSSFAVNATLTGVDVAKAVAFAGRPGTVTGKASGAIRITGTGVTADEVIKSTTGTMRLDATDGTVKGLGLVKAIVLASSMRASSQAQVANARSDEPFKRMGMSLRIAGGKARTDDLKFESQDILLNAVGDLKLDGTDVDLAGNVQLSHELTKSAGRDLVLYTQKDGKVTLPVVVSGPPEALKVRLDIADVAKRAITNKAKEEGKKAVLKGLGKIIKK